MSINVICDLQEDEWRHFVEKHPQSNIFHTPEMFQVFLQTKNFRPKVWAAIENRRILALMVPVKITLMDGFLRRFTSRSVVFGSVLFTPGAKGQKALVQLLQTYLREVKGTQLFTELRNLTDLEEIQPILHEHGFVYEDHLNYLIDLNRSPEAVMQNIGRRTRKHIRRGLRQGKVLVEEATERDQLAVCYDLLHKTYRKAKVPLPDRTLFKAAFDVLYAKRMVRYTLAYVGHTAVATSVELLYKDIIYGWYGGVDRAYSSYMPNELLMWQILNWGAENEYRLYDFGGAGKPDEDYGVRDFKAKFGGQLVSYGRNTYIHAHKTLWLSKQGYRILRSWL